MIAAMRFSHDLLCGGKVNIKKQRFSRTVLLFVDALLVVQNKTKTKPKVVLFANSP